MNGLAQFLTRLDARWLNDTDRELLSALAFYSKKYDTTFSAPAGFITDLASVPRLPFIFWLFGGSADEPAVIHDYLYSTGLLSRKDADEVFAEACKSKGLASGPRWLAVRLFGGSRYTDKK